MDFFLVILAYLLGSISFAYVLTKYKLHEDIRKLGSGNAGTTNVQRVLGTKYAVLVLAGDVLKGAIPVILAYNFAQIDITVMLCGLAAIAGHNWPIFMGFRGGKGIATSIGVYLAFDPVVAAICMSIGLALIIATRYVSLGSITGMAILPIVTFLFYGVSYTLLFAILVGFFSIYRHRTNITRLLNGTENKFGQKKS
ncbi:MAG: glycerol-3-phosphate 1-O-acyltransferase PlsY [Eubacteriaceae bacterium]|nr:glycerol-3-phosphate 1-O-acyltransferase PlsY [Eubacteriaceae bacterium]